MYPRDSASPPALFAQVVNVATGGPVTSGVAAKYSTGAGAQSAGQGTLRHEGNGQWSYTPTQAETDVATFGVQFYHVDAVSYGPTVSVVTSARDEAGDGPVLHVVHVKDEDDTAVQGALVIVSASNTGQEPFAAFTNSQGDARFWLAPGTYYAWVQRTGFATTDAQAFTVS